MGPTQPDNGGVLQMLQSFEALASQLQQELPEN
jgi:hypothetical protein